MSIRGEIAAVISLHCIIQYFDKKIKRELTCASGGALLQKAREKQQGGLFSGRHALQPASIDIREKRSPFSRKRLREKATRDFIQRTDTFFSLPRLTLWRAVNNRSPLSPLRAL